MLKCNSCKSVGLPSLPGGVAGALGQKTINWVCRVVEEQVIKICLAGFLLGRGGERAPLKTFAPP